MSNTNYGRNIKILPDKMKEVDAARGEVKFSPYAAAATWAAARAQLDYAYAHHGASLDAIATRLDFAKEATRAGFLTIDEDAYLSFLNGGAA